METWLVTGANGFLGSNAGRVLSPMYDTVGLVRSGIARNFSRTIKADLTEKDEVYAALSAVKPQIILHCAALADHQACEADPHLARLINVDTSQILAAWAADTGARFIHISTDAVFDGRTGNYSENDAVNPFSAYGESKAQAEISVLDANGDALVVRTNFFGWSPSGKSSVLEYFTTALRGTSPIPAYTDYVVSSIHVASLIESVVAINVLNTRGLLHIASSDSRSKFEFGCLIANEMEIPIERLLPASRWGNLLRGDPVSLSLNVNQVEELLQTKMPTQHSGIVRAFAESSRPRMV